MWYPYSSTRYLVALTSLKSSGRARRGAASKGFTDTGSEGVIFSFESGWNSAQQERGRTERNLLSYIMSYVVRTLKQNFRAIEADSRSGRANGMV